MPRSRTPVLAAMLLLVGCGGGDGKTPFTELTGIYQITGWTENLAGCAAEGPSVLADRNERYLWVKPGDLGFAKFLGLVTCTDLPACRTEAAGEVPLFGAYLLAGDDRDGWTGQIAYASSGATPGTCTGGVMDLRLTSPAGGQLAFRVEARNAPTFPATGDVCEPEAARAAVASRPCETLQVIGASFLERLP